MLECMHSYTGTLNEKPAKDYLVLDTVCLNETSVNVSWYPLNEPLQLLHLEYRCYNTASGINEEVS